MLFYTCGAVHRRFLPHALVFLALALLGAVSARTAAVAAADARLAATSAVAGAAATEGGSLASGAQGDAVNSQSSAPVATAAPAEPAEEGLMRRLGKQLVEYGPFTIFVAFVISGVGLHLSEDFILIPAGIFAYQQ